MSFNPTKGYMISMGLTGTGLGALAGADMAVAIKPKKGEKKYDKKRMLKYIVGGALTGATIGSLWGRGQGKAEYNAYRKASDRIKEDYQKNKTWWDEQFRKARNEQWGKQTTNQKPNVGAVGKNFESKLLKQTKKIDAQTLYKQHARQHHPDKGGKLKDMQDINNVWNSFKKEHFEKLAHKIKTFYRI